MLKYTIEIRPCFHLCKFWCDFVSYVEDLRHVSGLMLLWYVRMVTVICMVSFDCVVSYCIIHAMCSCCSFSYFNCCAVFHIVMPDTYYIGKACLHLLTLTLVSYIFMSDTYYIGKACNVPDAWFYCSDVLRQLHCSCLKAFPRWVSVCKCVSLECGGMSAWCTAISPCLGSMPWFHEWDVLASLSLSLCLYWR